MPGNVPAGVPVLPPLLKASCTGYVGAGIHPKLMPKPVAWKALRAPSGIDL